MIAQSSNGYRTDDHTPCPFPACTIATTVVSHGYSETLPPSSFILGFLLRLEDISRVINRLLFVVKEDGDVAVFQRDNAFEPGMTYFHFNSSAVVNKFWYGEVLRMFPGSLARGGTPRRDCRVPASCQLLI